MSVGCRIYKKLEINLFRSGNALVVEDNYDT